MGSVTMKMNTKLTLAFGALMMQLMLVTALAWAALAHGNDTFDHFTQGITARSNVANAVRQGLDARAMAARNLALLTRPEDLAIERAHVEKAHRTATEHDTLRMRGARRHRRCDRLRTADRPKPAPGARR